MQPHESRRGNHTSNRIDEASDESFPASDPPAFNSGMSEADRAAAAYVSKSAGRQPLPLPTGPARSAACCPSSLARWGLLAGTAAVGFVVGRLLAGRR